MGTFDSVSGDYRDRSLVQRQAAEKLLGILVIEAQESVLDVGCGPGHITAEIAARTGGRVVGADISQGMIDEARSRYPALEFGCVAAEEMEYEGEFDVVFCNSTLQWFYNAVGAIASMFTALGKPGRLGLSCPATPDFAPWFNAVVAAAGKRPELAPVFARWRNPWFQLAELEQYRTLFERSGFKTHHATIDHEVSEHTVEEAYGIYFTGAAQGFAGKEYYDVEADDAYVEAFNRAVLEEMEKTATGGRVEVDFNRLYYIGLKR